MSRTLICCELATAHGGDIHLAADMIRAAADAGADLAKLQTYSLAALNPADPQREWFVQAHLDKAAHEALLQVGQDCGIEVFSTPFDRESLQMLRDLGLKRFKVASSESCNTWWDPQAGEQWLISWPWGRADFVRVEAAINLTAIPLYPTPLEAVGRAALLMGWSDHCASLTACYRAMARGVKIVEVHFCIPGRSRVKEFDKTAADVRKLRTFADEIATIESGVSQVYRERWKRA